MKDIRLKPGFFRPGLSNFSSIQTLLGDFINDRSSPSLLNEFYIKKAKSLSRNTWNEGTPFEKVVESNEDLRDLLTKPHLITNYTESENKKDSKIKISQENLLETTTH